MKEFLTGTGTILALICLIFWAGIAFKDWQCSQRWADFDNEWSFGAGCRVSVDGRMVPEDRVREMQP